MLIWLPSGVEFESTVSDKVGMGAEILQVFFSSIVTNFSYSISINQICSENNLPQTFVIQFLPPPSLSIVILRDESARQYIMKCEQRLQNKPSRKHSYLIYSLTGDSPTYVSPTQEIANYSAA